MARPRMVGRTCLRRGVTVVACTLASFALALPAFAATIFENAGVQVTGFAFDPSLRSLAMGGASGAVFWGLDPNYWANPALLGFVEGVAYEDATHGTLLSDASSRRLSLGYGGLGLATAGPPFSGLTQFALSYEFLGSDNSDEVHSWGIGASISRILSTLAALRGNEAPEISRYVDIALGYNHKTDQLDTGVAGALRTTGTDWGVLARGTAPFTLGPGGIPARAEAAYGYSVQNANDAKFGGFASVNRPHRHSVAARFALDQPASWSKRVPNWLAPGLEPLVSVGGAWDRVFISAGDGPIFSDESHLGGELSLANVVFVRLGRDDNSHDWGYGFALPLGQMGGLQYNQTRRNSDNGFPALWSHAWLFWLNPVEIARVMRATR